MNAHINLDLGVAAADAGGGAPLDAVRADFDAVNDVLGQLIDGCQGALDEVSPWLGLADRVGGRGDEAVIRFSLVAARRQAWSVADPAQRAHRRRPRPRDRRRRRRDGEGRPTPSSTPAWRPAPCCSRCGPASGRRRPR